MITGTGITGRAVALTESGLLVNGWTVTDLLSGFTVHGEADDAVAAAGTGPRWRGSAVPLSRLAAVRELVAEALAERAADPELTSANPTVPRVLFPWGVGESHTDVLVTGPDARVTAAYLRDAGLRARCVDQDAALRIAADLEIARAELSELEDPDDPYDPYDGIGEIGGIGDGEGDDLPGDHRTGFRTVSRGGFRSHVRRGRTVIAGLVVGLVLVGMIAVAAVRDRGAEAPVTASSQGRETAQEAGNGTAAPSAVAAPAETPSATADTTAPAFGDPVLRGAGGQGRVGDRNVGRAATPVTADLDGWFLHEATELREIWMSVDPDVRILVAATPTPLGTQQELDAKMLAGLSEVQGIRVTATGPVDYEETNPGSVTRWQVRLIDRHQVSVGCQYREGTGEQTARRLAACDRFTATARVG